jgi:hypothetical protein
MTLVRMSTDPTDLHAASLTAAPLTPIAGKPRRFAWSLPACGQASIRWGVRLPLALLAASTVIAISACGSSAGSQSVVRVGTHTITRDTVNHWTHIVAVKDYRLKPVTLVPPWVVPDPPRYTACVAHLEALAKQPPSSSTPPVAGTPAQLKGRCEAKYIELRDQAVSFLINCEALLQEGAARGLTASDSEIKQRFARVKQAEFPSKGTFQPYLKAVGETLADQMFRARIKVFTKKIQAQILGAKGKTQAQHYEALAKFGNDFPVRWARKTHCDRGYIVPNCSEYRGPLKPQLII